MPKPGRDNPYQASTFAISQAHFITMKYLFAALIFLVQLYCLCIFGWAALYSFFGDSFWWLFLLNCFAVYYFAPLPLALLIALIQRQPAVLLSLGLVSAIGLHLYGPQFNPWPGAAAASVHELRVMSYNVLVFNKHADAVVEALRQSEADIIVLQEVSPLLRETINRDLAGIYPYQVYGLPRDIGGLFTISRYPLRPTGRTFPDQRWQGPPQVLELDFQGTPVILVNVHAAKVAQKSTKQLAASVRYRERQAQVLAAFARSTTQPLIVAGDFNSTPQSTAYRTMVSALDDSWAVAGFGLGHTFPGSSIEGSARPVIRGWRVPQWLVRIDYIFYSPHWRANTCRIGPWDGFSDHRPVVCSLTLTSL